MRKGKCIVVIFCLLAFYGSAQKLRPIKITAANANIYRDSLNKVIFGTTVFPYTIMPDSIFINVNVIDLYSGFRMVPHVSYW